jgi:hypothetical protein
MDNQAPHPDVSERPLGPVWLTYVELGDRLGITPDAARQKAIRGRWRKQRGNDGKARVLVEPEVLQSAVQTHPHGDHTDVHLDERTDSPAPVQTPETPQANDNSATEAALVAMLDDQLAFLKGLVESERSRADRLQDELLSLTKAHTSALERHAAELKEAREVRKVSWWRRWA